MTNSFKISATYWAKLTEKEKYFMQLNAIQHGISYCKRILALARVFPEWEEIHCSSLYIDGEYLKVNNSWLIFRNNQVVGIIKKRICVFGISERLYVKDLSGFREIWNNWKTRNPNSSEKQEIARLVQECIL